MIVGSRGREEQMAVDADAYMADTSRAEPGVRPLLLQRRADSWNGFAQAGRNVRKAPRRLHGVSPQAAKTTGARCFCQWFDQQASTTRETFCRRIRLDPIRPYFCIFVDHNSSQFATRDRSSGRGSSGSGAQAFRRSENAACSCALTQAMRNYLVAPRRPAAIRRGKSRRLRLVVPLRGGGGINRTGMIEVSNVGEASF